MARAKNPDLRQALTCAKQTAYADTVVTAVAEVIVEMYDLDYAGIPEIIDKVLTDDLDSGQAVRAITALKVMYNGAAAQ